jgi:hypothetical protein
MFLFRINVFEETNTTARYVSVKNMTMRKPMGLLQEPDAADRGDHHRDAARGLPRHRRL